MSTWHRQCPRLSRTPDWLEFLAKLSPRPSSTPGQLELLVELSPEPSSTSGQLDLLVELSFELSKTLDQAIPQARTNPPKKPWLEITWQRLQPPMKGVRATGFRHHYEKILKIAIRGCGVTTSIEPITDIKKVRPTGECSAKLSNSIIWYNLLYRYEGPPSKVSKLPPVYL